MGNLYCYISCLFGDNSRRLHLDFGSYAQKKKINQIINKLLESDISNYDMDFRDKLDSLKIVTLIIEIEEQYGIMISDEDFDIEKISTINKICDLINKYGACL